VLLPVDNPDAVAVGLAIQTIGSLFWSWSWRTPVKDGMMARNRKIQPPDVNLTSKMIAIHKMEWKTACDNCQSCTGASL
jgi:hypothetical protein